MEAEINLIGIIGEYIDCSLKFNAAFHCKTGVYFPENIIDIRIFPNNLKGGYLGNTLLVELPFNRDFNQSIKDIRIGDYIFVKSQIVIPYDNKGFCLKGKAGYLRLKADFLTSLN